MNKIILAAAVAIASLSASVSANAYQLSIANDTSWSISYFYISPSNSTVWGNDQLGSDVIGRGERQHFNVRGGRYDVRIIDQDGDACNVMDVQISSNTSWRLTDRWLLNCQRQTPR